MNLLTYAKYLFFTIAMCLVSFALFNLILPLSPYTDFLVKSILFFLSLAALTYLFGELSIKSGKGNGFIFIVVANVLFKLIASFLFVGLYIKSNPPDEKLFIVPFLLSYLCFAVFETFVLSLQAREVK